MVQTQTHDKEGSPRFYTLFVDNTEYRVDKPELTGGEIMDLASIPRDAGLILIEEDGTQAQVRPEQIVELKPGRRFKKAPRFIRGAA
jgi:hypothetical protein